MIRKNNRNLRPNREIKIPITFMNYQIKKVMNEIIVVNNNNNL